MSESYHSYLYPIITDDMMQALHGTVIESRSVKRSVKQWKSDNNLPHTINYLENKYYTWRATSEAAESLPEEPSNFLPSVQDIGYTDRVWAADLHLPYINTLCLTEFLGWSKAHGYTECVLGGDIIDFDWCSHWPSGVAAGNAPQVEDQIKYCFQIFRAMLGVFKKIYWIPGNHEARALRTVAHKLNLVHWQRLFLTDIDERGMTVEDLSSRVEIVSLPHLRITGGPTGDWMICHQKNYRKTPGSVAAELCNKYECNVVTTHEHTGAEVPSKTSAKWQGVASHCMADPRKVEYKWSRISLHNNWTLGWGYWQDGVGRLVRFSGDLGGAASSLTRDA
jgi:hypothetical protein